MTSAPRRHLRPAAAEPDLSLRTAKAAGLIDQPTTKHLNAKVSPALFEAAALRVGSRSPTAVIKAALAALAMQEDLGPWLAEQWGTLAGLDSEILDELEI